MNFGPQATVPERFRNRKFHVHNPTVTLMRTTPEECRKLGEEIGSKAAASTGPVAILFPSKGISAIDADGQPFEDIAAREALRDGLLSSCGPVAVDVRPEHINDPSFAEAAARKLLELISLHRR
ncbi:MAG: Tm-1-like ATP-binding domain-containing protein [Planctomycetaceae bacterium]